MVVKDYEGKLKLMCILIMVCSMFINVVIKWFWYMCIVILLYFCFKEYKMYNFIWLISIFCNLFNEFL